MPNQNPKAGSVFFAYTDNLAPGIPGHSLNQQQGTSDPDPGASLPFSEPPLLGPTKRRLPGSNKVKPNTAVIPKVSTASVVQPPRNTGTPVLQSPTLKTRPESPTWAQASSRFPLRTCLQLTPDYTFPVSSLASKPLHSRPLLVCPRLSSVLVWTAKEPGENPQSGSEGQALRSPGRTAQQGNRNLGKALQTGPEPPWPRS